MCVTFTREIRNYLQAPMPLTHRGSCVTPPILHYTILRVMEANKVPPPEPYEGKIYDYRGKQKISFRGKGLLRDPEDVVAVCCHQTAIEFGGQKKHAALYGEVEAHHRRFWSEERGCGVPYHVVTTRTRHMLLISDVLAYKYHGDALNRDSIGWAVEGRFPAFARDRTDKHTAISEDRIAAWRISLRKTIELGLEAGCPLQYVYAHRQSAGGKPGDPGEEIWRLIVMPVAREFGLSAQPDMVRKPKKGKMGLPLPKEWTL